MGAGVLSNRMRKILMILLTALALLVFGCQHDSVQLTESQRELVIYSDLNSSFVRALTEGFSRERNIGLRIMSLDQLDGSKQHADIVLTSHIILNRLARAGSFEVLNLPALDHIYDGYKDSHDYWAGVFYDSLTIVVNKEFSRKHGQVNVSGWQDLLKLPKCRIVAEHFDNSDLQRQILAAFASKMGVREVIDYFSSLEKKVVKYSKFSFTPMRMLVAGDADIAITLKSYAYEFAGDDFPAYLVEPKDGTPAVIYGAAIYKGSDSLVEAKNFVQWLLSSPNVRKISLREETGLDFIMPRGIPGPVVNSKKLWFNTKFLEQKGLDDLVNEWYEKVRFKGLF